MSAGEYGNFIPRLLAILLVFCIIASATAPVFDEKADIQQKGVIRAGTIFAAILAVGSGILLIPNAIAIETIRKTILGNKLSRTKCALLCAGSFLTLIPLSAIWHDSKNAKATWVMVMNGLGTAFYGAAAASLVIPSFHSVPHSST